MKERETILAASFGFVVTVVCAFVVDAVDNRREIISGTERNLRNTAALVAEQTRQLFETADLALKAVILARQEWQAESAHSPASGHRSVRGIQNTSNLLEGLGWTNRDGDREVSSVYENPPPLNIADQSHFRAHTLNPKAGFYISAPIVSRLTGAWISPVSRRINASNGEFAGVALATLNASYLSRVLERYYLAEKVNLSLYLRDGTYIARFPDPASRIGRSNSQGPLFREYLPKSDVGTYHGIASPSGEERIFSYRAVTGYPVVVAVSISRAVALAAWHDRIRITGAVALLAILGAIAAAIRLWVQAQRLRAERRDALLAKLGAEAANRSKSEFLAQMSHELRTPMNAVLGFTEMMTKEVFGPVGSPRYREYLRDIESSGQHLLQVINNILDLAKVEAGKWEMEEEVVDLVDVGRSTALLLHERARAAGVVLEIDEASPALAVRGDPRLLRQIVLNLLSNGIKFSDRGGRVRLLWRSDEHGGVMIEVADEGIGMTPEEVQQALQPYASNSKRARRRQDTGLGLSICKHFAEMHGGRLVIASELGRGTTVTVHLPAERMVDRAPPITGAAAA